MSSRIATTLAAIAMTLSLGALAAPAAVAAPLAPAPTPAVGSISVCLNLPLGSASISFCI
ncbi:hypothetical protein C8E05_3028 [Rhodococcus wratislaviensis]|uniref:Uncharacterized protein n=3 Tax=Rhodococcus TaxID=1827 RepID=A0AB38FIF0_RHOWR|nr:MULTISPECIES: hypothetical protein [Rhodococcus]AII06248.1 membrane protein [Rhodococcus opacus]PBC54330.1 hypothetical protein CJ177_26770 [Rhodococcus sp. ACPA1]REE73614.1 hypothetical protein C8E05_3028 [Rhodococcus wratislaviensis]WAM17407.1 hypothetical protein OYT95_12560 [Rhodococcus sp. JS3073]SPZ41473.1 Uncharacterised protein [Rhodococcus wratislaviensis]